MKKNKGFTLIELMIVVTITGILAAIVFPIYLDAIRKSRRSDGIAALLSIQLAEEKFRVSNPTYGTLTQVYSGATSSPKGHYSLAVSNIAATSYTLTATGQGDQSNDDEKGANCGTLTVTVNNASDVKGPAVCW